MDIPPRPVSNASGLFSYDKRGFYVTKEFTTRMPLHDLQALFPNYPVADRFRGASRAFIIAQLQLYGIPFTKTSLKGELFDALETAVKSGQLAPSADVQRIEDNLRLQWEAKLKEYHEKVDQRKAKEFADAKGDAIQELSADQDRFLAKYFLDGLHGNPDRNKTKEPLLIGSAHTLQDAINSVPGLVIYESRHITLVGWDTDIHKGIKKAFDSPRSIADAATQRASLDINMFLEHYFKVDPNNLSSQPEDKPLEPVILQPLFERVDELQTVVRQIPGLHVKVCKERFGTYTVIGWDLSKVEAVVERKFAKATKQQREAKAKAVSKKNKYKDLLQEHLKPHDAYLSTHQERPSTLTTSSLVGSYIVRCDHVYENWKKSEPMVLNIFPSDSANGLIASFHLNVFEGTMLLAPSNESLLRLREEQPKRAKADDEMDIDKDEGTGQKRLAPVEDPWGVRAAMAKRQKTSTPATEEQHPNRVYFQFACEQIGGAVEYDPDNKHVGHFDFDPSTYSAKGVFLLSTWTSKPWDMSIYKVDDNPTEGREPRPWFMFLKEEERRGEGGRRRYR